jgi:hypothetical protein
VSCAIILLCFTIGCSLTKAERIEEESNLRATQLGHPEIKYTEEVSPAAAFSLGLLPFGLAGFYVHSTWLAASGFLWPFSTLWLPKMAYDDAVDRNRQAFEMRMMGALEQKSSTDSPN